MKLLDLTLDSPAENLALDEALLDSAEAGQTGELLRFWESPTPFVVVGYANKIATEANVAVCEKSGVPILRRCSGGGTVVQGPGCLNYSVILRIDEHGPTRNIPSTNEFVMKRNRSAIAALLDEGDSKVSIQGHTDLAIGNLKFSGNAQRRRKAFLLFHGTFLLKFNLSIVGELLRMPSQQPEYRANREHVTFIMNLNAPAPAVKQTLANAWQAWSPSIEKPTIPPGLIAKYRAAAWNFKF